MPVIYDDFRKKCSKDIFEELHTQILAKFETKFVAIYHAQCLKKIKKFGSQLFNDAKLIPFIESLIPEQYKQSDNQECPSVGLEQWKNIGIKDWTRKQNLEYNPSKIEEEEKKVIECVTPTNKKVTMPILNYKERDENFQKENDFLKDREVSKFSINEEKPPDKEFKY